MLREYQRLIDKITIIISGLVIFAAYYFWYWLINPISGRLATFNDYAGGIIVFIVTVLLCMFTRGLSTSRYFILLFDILKELLICYAIGALVFGFFIYLFNIPHFSRFYVLGGMVFSYGAAAIYYISHSFIYRNLSSHKLNYRNALLIGNRYTLPPFITTIKNNKALGLNIMGIMTLEEFHEKTFMGYRYLGNIHSIKDVLNSEPIDYTIFTIYRQDPQAVEKAMLTCQERGIDIWLKPDFLQKIMLSRVDYLGGIPLFVFSLGPKNELALMLKRLADIVLSLFLLIVLALPMLIIAVLVRKTTKGPAVFKQKRMGLNGRKFVMYKFRTMHTSAQQRRSEHKLKNEMKGPVFKMKCDPRVTPVGLFLRKYSMDELPQFWNVLVGDMSIVGPRPPLPSEADLYKGWQRRRLSMRPGITCIWQTSGRNRISNFDEWVKLDLKYIDTWNLWPDIKIFFKTIFIVFQGTGW